MVVLDFTVGQRQHVIVRFWKSCRVGFVTKLQGLICTSRNPDAPCAVLKHDCRSGLIVSDDPVYPDPLGLIVHVIDRENPVHGDERKCPWAGTCALHNSDVRQIGNLEQNSCQLHLAVEAAGNDCGHLNLGVKKVACRVRLVTHHKAIDIPAVHDHMKLDDA